MQTTEISMKSKIIYLVTVCMIGLLLWMGDEGRCPLQYAGSHLQHSVGLIDSEDSLLLRESVAVNGVVASTPQYVMNRGTYTFTLEYAAEEADSVLELWEQGRKLAAWPMDPLRSKMTEEFTLSKDAKQMQLQVNYSGKGALTIKKLSLMPRTLFYTDTYFFLLIFFLCSLAVWKYWTGDGKKRLTQEQLVDYSVILGVALLATTPMMQTFLYNGDDLCFHLARLEGLKDGILDGQIPVNIQPEGLGGNGYLNAMYPYLFLYIGAFLRICRVSLGLSYKVLIFLANLGSAVCAYAAVRSMCRSRRSIILGVVIYTLMPYRFTNIFSRGDLGETLALVFWPLLIAGLYHVIMGERKYWYFLVIGFSGILQSHILSAAYAAAFCVVTALVWCVKILRERRYVQILKAVGVTILLNIWYLVPFVYYYFKEDLSTEVLRWSGYFEQSINPSNFTQTLSLYNKQYFSFGLALLGCVGIGVIFLLCERDRKKTERDGFLLYLLVLGVMLAFMTTGYFPSRAMLANSLFHNIATMMQFPWRFLGPASACFLFVGVIGLSESQILKPHRNQLFALLVGLNLLVIVSVPSDNSHMPYANAQSVASKGHESKMASNIGLFYAFEWRIEGAGDDEMALSVVTSDIEHVTVKDFRKKGTKAVLVYTADAEGAYIEIPIQGYLGYRAYDENGDRVTIDRGLGARMRFTVKGDGMEHQINIRYGPVPAFVLANLVTALTIAAFVLQAWKRRRKSASEEGREETQEA
ncbi:MAG: YfhO family protein [Lachnospiraceae bacterium]|nr:YfhO family protein [Lachnospiraceae bacterium]